MSASPVLTSVQDGIGTITLNRPEARNALNQAMRPALAAAIAQMRDDAQVHAVILTCWTPAAPAWPFARACASCTSGSPNS